MNKSMRGLPDDYKLNVKQNSPVILGSFMEEVGPSPATQTVETPANHRPIIPSQQNKPLGVNPLGDRTTFPLSALHSGTQQNPALFSRRAPKKPRIEISMNPETKRMMAEILQFVRETGPQPPAAASELIQGILSIVHSALGNLDLSNLSPRGQWGTQSAKTFPLALGRAFANAIIASYGEADNRTSLSERGGPRTNI